MLTDKSSLIVRQFSCSKCNRSWWRRVRFYKQVSACNRCHQKYQPVAFNKEFGMGEFVCACSNQVREWCEKCSQSTCRKCNRICNPSKIILDPKKEKTNGNIYRPTRLNDQQKIGRIRCNRCSDTQIDMESTVIFKPGSNSQKC